MSVTSEPPPLVDYTTFTGDLRPAVYALVDIHRRRGEHRTPTEVEAALVRTLDTFLATVLADPERYLCHPSIRVNLADRYDLVRMTTNLPRTDP